MAGDTLPTAVALGPRETDVNIHNLPPNSVERMADLHLLFSRAASLSSFARAFCVAEIMRTTGVDTTGNSANSRDFRRLQNVEKKEQPRPGTCTSFIRFVSALWQTRP